jgi:hypothetical protein
MGREEPSRPQGSCDESADQGRSCHGLDLPSRARQAVGGRSCRLGVERGQTSRASRRLKRGRAPTPPLCAMYGGWSTPEPAVWVAADRRRDCGRWLAVRADLSRIRSSQLPDLGACSSMPTAECRAERFTLRYDEAQFDVWGPQTWVLNLQGSVCQDRSLLHLSGYFGASAPNCKTS